MRRTILPAVSGFLFLLLGTGRLFAQIEHVPVRHPVYEYLERMQVAGLIPDYSRAMLPLQSREVALLLDAVHLSRHRLSETESLLLARYMDEFNAELDGSQIDTRIFGAGPVAEKMDGIFSDSEKNLYSWRDSTTTFYIEFLGSAEFATLSEGERWPTARLGRVGGRFRGTVRGFLGYSLQATNSIISGSRELLSVNRTLHQNAQYREADDSFFDFAEAYLSADFGWGRILLGKERILAGLGTGTKLVISDNAPAFDAVRFEARYGGLRYFFLHSSLLDRKQRLLNGQAYYDPKFLAFHRAEASLFDAVRFGLFESVIYTKRFVDLAYLNPINFYTSADHSLGDRDNPLLGFDLQTTSIPGVQLDGTWLIDDIDFSKMGSGWWGNKFAWQGGVSTTYPFTDTDLRLEYTRVEPYTFSHFYPENAYTNKDLVIGSTVDPNGDRWLFRVRHWIGERLLLSFSYLRDRHGANETDSAGVLTRNVGGDARVGLVYGRDAESVTFLDGNLYRTDSWAFNLRYEPFRNIVLDLFYMYRAHHPVSPGGSSSDHTLSLILDVVF